MTTHVNPTDSLSTKTLPVDERVPRRVEKTEEQMFPTTKEVSEVGLGAISIGMRAAEIEQELDAPYGCSTIAKGFSLGKAITEKIDKVISWLKD